jgi:uncharacterized repeat protein (TIGR01451 family)
MKGRQASNISPSFTVKEMYTNTPCSGGSVFRNRAQTSKYVEANMTRLRSNLITRLISVGLTNVAGLLLVLTLLVTAQLSQFGSRAARAEPLPGGVPKLIQSFKTVTPTLAAPGNALLTYTIHLVNTGAWTATNASLQDILPVSTTYVPNSSQASAGLVQVQSGVLTWAGEIGFDSAVMITYVVQVNPAFTAGQIVNMAVVSDAQIASPVTLTAVSRVTSSPVFTVTKASAPELPGPNQTLLYTLTVTNEGQPAVNLPVTVTEQVPLSTTLQNVGTGGITDTSNSAVTWTQNITLAFGESTAFTFSVKTGAVPSGTIISNTNYAVKGPGGAVAYGEPYTTTIVNPDFSLSKQTLPDPPGSNRELTYTLTLLNKGSLATGIVVTDRVPMGVTYVRGGSLASGVVSWSLSSLATNESAQLTYTVSISDVADVSIVNDDYHACSVEGTCKAGEVLTSVVAGPNFQVSGSLVPIAKSPGGSNIVTPTLTLRNLGPGSALNAVAILSFYRISAQLGDLTVIPTVGSFSTGPTCGDKCVSYFWRGDVAAGQILTFTTLTGQSTIGGAEGDTYTAALVVTDSLSNITTTIPVSATAFGKLTHFASLRSTKSAPAVIGRGQLLTYTIFVENTGLSADLPAVLTDVVPLSTTFVSASDSGVTQTLSNTLMVSWTLPTMGTGDQLQRTFTVRVDGNLVSGTKVVNNSYIASGYGNVVTGALTSGPAVTTTVKEVGLVDSFKSVTPTLALPGPDNVLTYVLHIVNSSELPLSGVGVTDVLPWQNSTYQRDAVTTSGQLISDIVSLRWTGDVGPLATERVTFTVRVDPDYKGALTNTAVISHPGLLSPVTVIAVAYVTDEPVLFISKSASPDPALLKEDLTYILRVTNLGQQATGLVVTDVVPAYTQYVTDSATANGQMSGGQTLWNLSVLKPGESVQVSYRVTVLFGAEQLVNDQYAVRSAEGVIAFGEPVVTLVSGGSKLYLPLIRK